MKLRLHVLFVVALTSFGAFGSEYGAIFGVHQTSASVDGYDVPTSVDARWNMKLGLYMQWEFGPGWSFTTGTIYTRRHFTRTVDGAAQQVNFEYVDVPAFVSYDVLPWLGVFLGPSLAININDKLEIPHLRQRVDPAVNGVTALATLGASARIAERWRVEPFYERGVGRIANNMKDFESYGVQARFVFQ